MNGSGAGRRRKERGRAGGVHSRKPVAGRGEGPAIINAIAHHISISKINGYVLNSVITVIRSVSLYER